MVHQVTVKGQITIPKKVRDYLGIGPGSGVDFAVDAKGEVLLRAAGRLAKRTRAPSRFAKVRGMQASGLSTEEIMNLLRGYAGDAQDPGLSADAK